MIDGGKKRDSRKNFNVKKIERSINKNFTKKKVDIPKLNTSSNNPKKSGDCLSPERKLKDIELEQVKSVLSEETKYNNQKLHQSFLEFEDELLNPQNKMFENAFESREKKRLQRILIKPIFGVSKELQKDLAYNGADNIYEKQK